MSDQSKHNPTSLSATQQSDPPCLGPLVSVLSRIDSPEGYLQGQQSLRPCFLRQSKGHR